MDNVHDGFDVFHGFGEMNNGNGGNAIGSGGGGNANEIFSMRIQIKT